MNEGKSSINTNPIHKKKPAVIDDYIGIPAVLKKDNIRNSTSKERPNT